MAKILKFRREKVKRNAYQRRRRERIVAETRVQCPIRIWDFKHNTERQCINLAEIDGPVCWKHRGKEPDAVS